MSQPNSSGKGPIKPYLSALGALALAFGCSVGWGAFVMPGSTFLPLSGPVGTAIGIGLGALVMILIAVNYHTLMKRFPEGGGGTYTYTKKVLGYDQGFLAAWFMGLTYVAIIWANATALPLIARIFLPGVFQWCPLYEIAGFQVYLGEIFLAVGALGLGALACFRRRLASRVQIGMAIGLFFAVIICFIAAFAGNGGTLNGPSFSPSNTAFAGTVTIFALAPWAFVGFESISHSSGEAKFPMKKAFAIMAIAVIAAGLIYILLVFLSCSAIPGDRSSWVDYFANLSSYSGPSANPTFYGARVALGKFGSVLIGIAALCAIFTGIIGNYIALSRLLTSMSDDGLLPKALGRIDSHGVPKTAIIAILCVSIILPFFGRTAISWIVDVTTVGATIAFAFTSASAFKVAREQKARKSQVFAVIGMLISLVFAIVFLIPNILSVSTLSTESYFILAAWGILGFVVFLIVLHHDTNRHFGRTTVAWVVLLGLVIFASSVWIRQTLSRLLSESVATVEASFIDKLGQATSPEEIAALESSMRDAIAGIETHTIWATVGQIGLIVFSLAILFLIYAKIQKRQQQMEVEKAIAEGHSRAKTSFLSNMSHEIRTPMNAIIGLDSIALRDPNLSPKTRENLEKIGASAKHLLGLINDILDMSRIESGQMSLKSEEFPFHDLIEQVSIIINGQCLDKGLRYECAIAGKLSDYYVGDDMKLKQILINIMGNAVKFTNSGSVKLTISETKRENGLATLTFLIEDTGVGMDKEYIPKIFESFSQEDASTTNRYGGSGLGMAITKNFVDMMGGRIDIESEKGVGSKFTVTLSLGTSDKRYLDNSGISLKPGLRALIIDDDPISCEQCELALKGIGVDAVSIQSPKEAVGFVKEAFEKGKPYELVLTDYRMPEMDGLEVSKAIRKFDNGKTIVFVVTGYNSDIVEEQLKENEVDGVIGKPLFPANLLKAIQSTLAKRGESSTDNKAEEKSSLAGYRILMAEDVDANAEILADLLELEEIESERACNGEEAVKMFVDKPPHYYDAILMDVRMPIKDGLTATSEIRSLDKEDAKTIPIIAMTANVFDEDKERSFAAGMNAHLSKPIEPDKLYDELRRQLQK